MKEYIPPLVILLLNQLLIMLIDYAGIFENNLFNKSFVAYMEKHSTYSLFQISIFRKSMFYLMLNMVIIPGLTIATAGNIIKK